MKKNKDNVSVLSGWRLKLFNRLLDDGLIKIKNKRLIVTDKFIRKINSMKRHRRTKNGTRTKSRHKNV